MALPMSAGVQTRTIQTRIPGRLDRLPWSSFHWRVLLGLGTVWILDGLSTADVGVAAAVYVVGACVGALFFGQLTDRFGRKKLFMLTLGIYIVATVATAFSFAPWYFFLARVRYRFRYRR
jgi:MFS family permease